MDVVVIVSGRVPTKPDHGSRAVLRPDPRAHDGLTLVVPGELHDQVRLGAGLEGTVALGELDLVLADLDRVEGLLIPVVVLISGVVLPRAVQLGAVRCVSVSTRPVVVVVVGFPAGSQAQEGDRRDGEGRA